MADPENPESASDKPEQPEKSEGEGLDVGVGNAKVHVSEIQFPFMGMLFSGMVLIIAINSGIYRDHKYWAYGTSLGAVTMFFSLVGAIMTMKNEGMIQKAGKMNAYFLFLWCFIGACFMTFGKGPFTITGNGYFSSWAMAIFSIQAAGVSGEAMKKNIKGMSSMIGLLASSAIVLVAVATLVGKNTSYKNDAIYALVLSIVTIFVVAAFLWMERGEDAEKSKLKFPVMAVFAVMWIVEACLVTFRGPFDKTGNGYFASWGGALTSLCAAIAAK